MAGGGTSSTTALMVFFVSCACCVHTRVAYSFGDPTGFLAGPSFENYLCESLSKVFHPSRRMFEYADLFGTDFANVKNQNALFVSVCISLSLCSFVSVFGPRFSEAAL